MTEKKVNRIKGSLLYKFVLYVLIAVTAFTAAITAGLMFQMYCHGILGNQDRVQTDEIADELCDVYISDKIDELYRITAAYIDLNYKSFTNISTIEEYSECDTNQDGILNYKDLEAVMNNASFRTYFFDKLQYDEMTDAYAYSIDIQSSYGMGDIQCSYEKNMKMLADDSRDIYDRNFSLSWSGDSYIYSFYDTYDDADLAWQDMENELSGYEYDCDIITKNNNPEIQTVKNGYILKTSIYNEMELQINISCWVDAGQVINPYDIDYVNNKLNRWYNYKDDIVIMFIVSSIICVVLTILSMVHAGIKKGIEDIKLNLWERLPTEFILLSMTVAVVLFIMFCSEMYYYAGMIHIPLPYRYDMISDDADFWLIAVGATSCYLLILLILNNLIVKVKAKSFFKKSFLGKASRYLFGKLGRISVWFRYIKKRIPLCWKAVIVYAIVFIFCMILIGALLSGGEGVAIPVIILLAIVITLGYAGFIVMINELHKGGKELANGNMSHKIETKYMFGAFKEHGENLNNINESIQLAVEERMKSERMKTELITNVSHDIKTPLTSIINYVDLLEKEGIEKEPEKSYIDVLARQSARLKKLIVDLVDASKASTGNVDIELECMDANMLLTQAAAEYEDKLSNNGMILIVNTIPAPANIMADGRHLWRVFDNLLNNASKYAMEGTRVYAQVESNSEKVVIVFKNISKEPLNISSDDLMERFIRGDSSRNTEGSGLGLSIAKSLCNLMGAEFDIKIDGDLFKAIVTFNAVK